jgi:hypothetical protein
MCIFNSEVGAKKSMCVAAKRGLQGRAAKLFLLCGWHFHFIISFFAFMQQKFLISCVGVYFGLLVTFSI